MPFKSQKQRAFFHACASGKGKMKCPPRKVLNEFFAADHAAKRRKRK